MIFKKNLKGGKHNMIKYKNTKDGYKRNSNFREVGLIKYTIKEITKKGYTRNNPKKTWMGGRGDHVA